MRGLAAGARHRGSSGEDCPANGLARGWRFYAPFQGLVAYIADETRLVVYSGGAWRDYASVLALQNVPELGVNATADSTNKLAVASAAVLFNNIGNSVQVKLNKNGSADTASLLYQRAFSGRAEVGLTGDDNFHFKVSPDGSTFYEALILNRNTGSQLLKPVDVTGATAIGATHLGRMVRGDASGGAFNITLPPTADADDWAIVRKKDASANRVTVKDNAGNDMAWLSAQYDEAMFAFWDGAWTPVRWSIAPLAQVFTATATYAKPPLAKAVDVSVLSAGGGGASGRRGAAGTARFGGQGGQSGVLHRWRFPRDRPRGKRNRDRGRRRQQWRGTVGGQQRRRRRKRGRQFVLRRASLCRRGRRRQCGKRLRRRRPHGGAGAEWGAGHRAHRQLRHRGLGVAQSRAGGRLRR